MTNIVTTPAEILNAAADLIETEGYNKARATIGNNVLPEFVPGHGYTIDEALDFARLGRVMADDEADDAPMELKEAYVLVGDEMFFRQSGRESTFLDALIGYLQRETADWLGEANQDDVIALLRSVAQRELDEEQAA